MAPFRYLSICSGIEAASVAWAPLGWQAAGCSEIEPFPRAVLEQRLGAVPVDWDHRHRDGSNTVPLFGDFTRIEAHHVGPVDLLVGGTPCQSFSVAGKRLGLDDPRGHLTLEFLALAKRVRPRWLLWENVPGVLSDDGGRTFGTFLGLLGELRYGWAFRVIDAQFARVGGFERAVPQRRRRVFVVGYLGDAARAAAVLLDRESLRGNPAPRRQSGEGTAGATAGGVASGGRAIDPGFGVCGTLSDGAHMGGGLNGQDAYTGRILPVAHALRGEGFGSEAKPARPGHPSEDGTGRGTPLVPIAIRTAQTSANGHGIAEGVAHTLDLASGQAIAFDTTQITHPANRSVPKPGDACHLLAAGAHAPAVAFTATGQAGAGWAPPSFPVAVECSQTLDTRRAQSVFADLQVRRLTPTECERLQGFPDGWTNIEWRKKPAPDGPRYKALGNSMAVNVMRWIGERIALVDAA